MSENATRGPTAARADFVPRHDRRALYVPLLVFGLTGGLLAWNAWPTLRPLPTVRVTQAVFDAQAAPEPDAAAASPAGGGVTVQAPGWLEAEPFHIACTALTDGVIESVEVLEGDRVTAGQVVARMVEEDAQLRLARAEAEHATALAAVREAEANLAAAETDWEHPVELDRAVAAGRAAVAEARAELARLPAQIDAARATLVRLEEEHRKAQRSLAVEAATDLEVVITKQHAVAQQADLAALEGRRPVLQAQVDRLAAELRAAERNLELRVAERRALDAGRAELARRESVAARAGAVRDEAALELERMVIRAPIDGVVQRRLKVPGDKVMLAMDAEHSAHVLHLYDPARIQVRVDVPLADAAHVYVGQPCEVVVEVLPDETFAGEVLRVTHEADLQKNTLQVKVRVIDPSPLLRPEMLTRVRFLPRGGAALESDTSTGRQRIRVPADAVVGAGAARQVWTVRDRQAERGRLEPVAVELVEAGEHWATVAGDLSPGTWIVRDTGGLSAGRHVRVTELEARP